MIVFSECSKCWTLVKLKFREVGLDTNTLKKIKYYEGECPKCMVSIETRIQVIE